MRPRGVHGRQEDRMIGEQALAEALPVKRHKQSTAPPLQGDAHIEAPPTASAPMPPWSCPSTTRDHHLPPLSSLPSLSVDPFHSSQLAPLVLRLRGGMPASAKTPSRKHNFGDMLAKVKRLVQLLEEHLNDDPAELDQQLQSCADEMNRMVTTEVARLPSCKVTRSSWTVHDLRFKLQTLPAVQGANARPRVKGASAFELGLLHQVLCGHLTSKYNLDASNSLLCRKLFELSGCYARRAEERASTSNVPATHAMPIGIRPASTATPEAEELMSEDDSEPRGDAILPHDDGGSSDGDLQSPTDGRKRAHSPAGGSSAPAGLRQRLAAPSDTRSEQPIRESSISPAPDCSKLRRTGADGIVLPPCRFR
jgi:hypothetical protein